LRTLAEAIRILCRFGSRKDVEKAREVESLLENWLSSHIRRRELAITDLEGSSINSTGATREISSPSGPTLSICYRAMGICQAHWSRLSYDADGRSELQKTAVGSLKAALEIGLDESQNIDTLYALGLLLAEKRDLPGAIKVVKRAFTSSSSSGGSLSPDGMMSDNNASGAQLPHFSRERKLVPLWHLLALLLSARSDFSTASKSCEAAFEQFLSPENLFGDSSQTSQNDNNRSSSDQKPSKVETPSKTGSRAVEDFEKESMIQVKITQLGLIEVLEGPVAAVDACDELLALYARMFGDPNIRGYERTRMIHIEPPKSSAGTVKTIVGSVLGRSKSHRASKRNLTVESGDQQALSLALMKRETCPKLANVTVFYTMAVRMKNHIEYIAYSGKRALVVFRNVLLMLRMYPRQIRLTSLPFLNPKMTR
jgi:cargo-transport protein YPP1